MKTLLVLALLAAGGPEAAKPEMGEIIHSPALYVKMCKDLLANPEAVDTEAKDPKLSVESRMMVSAVFTTCAGMFSAVVETISASPGYELAGKKLCFPEGVDMRAYGKRLNELSDQEKAIMADPEATTALFIALSLAPLSKC